MLKAADFDIEALAMASQEEKEDLMFDAVLSVIDQDTHFVDRVGMVEERGSKN